MANQTLETATINEVSPEDWGQIKCADRPEQVLAYVAQGYVDKNYVEFTS